MPDQIIWPQVTYIILVAMSFGMYLENHGKPRSNYNIWGFLLNFAVSSWLLVSGGFFKPLGF